MERLVGEVAAEEERFTDLDTHGVVRLTGHNLHGGRALLRLFARQPRKD